MKKKGLSLLLCVVLLLSILVSAGAGQTGESYDPETVYYAGDTVIYDGVSYTAKWYTVGVAPDQADSAWERTPEYDADGVPIWYPGMACPGGSQVSHNGMVYEAKWWTTSEPGTDGSWVGCTDPVPVEPDPEVPVEPDPDVPAEPDPEVPVEPDPDVPAEPDVPADPEAWDAGRTYFNGDTVVYNGVRYTAKYYNVGEAPDTSDAWEQEVQYDENGIPIWFAGMVCTGGMKVSHNGTVYEAKWWTTSEPGTDSSWAGYAGDTPAPGEDPAPVDPNGPIQQYADHTVDPSLVSGGSTDFRTVGYFPFYSAAWADNIQWDCLTHIVYAFAFPDGQGGLQPLDDTALVQKLIAEGHRHGVKVLLGVGGWAYYGTIMEYRFDANTATPALTDAFSTAIVDLVDTYGFDGVDMDWEHPRAGTDSWRHYEALMVQLREKLGSDRLLTSAVLSGVTAAGVTYADAAAHTANVMAVCDWFNVMAYDCECTLDFCQDVAAYWCGTRGMPAHKVCMGVPFYAYPSWTSYAQLVAAHGETAVLDDMAGTSDYHNSVPTIQAKTRWAREYGLGGMMIWELSQDTTDPASSLLRAIHTA